MPITVTNQKQGELSPLYISNISKDLEFDRIVSQILVKPCREPLVANGSVTITSNSGTVDDDDIIANAVNCLGENWDTTSEEFMRQLMSQCLMYYNPHTSLGFREIFAVQAAAKEGVNKLPDPSSTVIYPALEVIQNANGFLSGRVSYEEMFVTFAYSLRQEIFGYYFANEVEFQNFMQFFDQQIALMGNNLDATCMQKVSDFKQCKLDSLTETFRVRDDIADENAPYTFARVLTTTLINYARVSGLAGIMPMNFAELIVPKNIVLFNLEKFAHAKPQEVTREFQDITKGINIANNIPMVSNKKLMSLTATPRAMRKSAAAAMAAAQQRNTMAARAKMTLFKKRMPTSNEYLTMLKLILKKMHTNRITMNVYKYSKPSFQKPNRRDPDDWNKQGKITSTKYSPDIHLYIDCSGSISEEDYATAVKMCIQLARKLNVDLYVNSFSHILSQTTKLTCKGKSLQEIYGKFLKIPKVTGGTNFEQMWHFINKSQKRQDELSLIISDMEWSAPGKFVKHPQNLYYVPIKTRYSTDTRQLVRECESFMRSMKHIEPDIRRRILL